MTCAWFQESENKGKLFKRPRWDSIEGYLEDEHLSYNDLDIYFDQNAYNEMLYEGETFINSWKILLYISRVIFMISYQKLKIPCMYKSIDLFYVK